MALFFFYLLSVSFSVSVSADPLSYFCYGGNYTANSAYQSNINLLLSSLSSSNATFLTASEGSIPDRAYGLVLCRGDVGPTDCAACLNNAAMDVLSLCPVSKKATVWYDNCQLRYDDLSFFSIVDNSQVYILTNVNNATTDLRSFVELERKLLDAVTYETAYNNSSSIKYFATGITTVSSSKGGQKIYALAQCTRDLSAEGCSRCLSGVRGYYSSGLEVKQGGRVLGKSCNFRYESYPFFAGRPIVSMHL